MNRNILVGILIVALILLVGYLVVNRDSVDLNPGQNATSGGTNNGGNNGGTSSNGTQDNAAAPTVVTNAGGVPTNSTAVVTGRVTPNGAPTTYWYEYGETTALGSRTSEQSIGSGSTPIPAPGYITGLKANTTYYFRLSAKNRISTVNGSVSSFATNENIPPPGGAPSANTTSASDITRTGATLNGRVDANQAATSYWFEYGLDAQFGQMTAIKSAGNGDNATAVSDSVSGLEPLTKYYFRLNAQNQFGTVNGATQTFTTRGPAASGVPTADTTGATKLATSSVTLNGRVNPNGAEATYWFEYSEDSLLGSLIGSGTSPKSAGSGTGNASVSSDVTGLSPNTKYFYRIVVRNQFGTVNGDIISFTTKRN